MQIPVVVDGLTVANSSSAPTYLLIGLTIRVQTSSNCFTGMSLFFLLCYSYYFLHFFKIPILDWIKTISCEKKSFSYIFSTFSYGDTSASNYYMCFFSTLWCNFHVYFFCPAYSINSLHVAFKYKQQAMKILHHHYKKRLKKYHL